MSDKAKTLPRAKREKSPSPSSNSFSSLKTATVGKFNSFRNKSPFLKKKKKHASSASSIDSCEPPNGSSRQDLNNTPELPEEPVGEPDATSTPTTAILDSVQSTGQKLKNPKKPKPPIKKIVKGGKGLLNRLKGKNESAAVVVNTTMDLRRTAAQKKDHDGQSDANASIEREELKNGDVHEMSVMSKDEWSTTATAEKVRKLSRLEIHESIYNEEYKGDGLPDPLTPEEEAFGSDGAVSPSTPESITSNGITPNAPISFDKKSPSTIKKDILSSINSASGKMRKTSDPISNGTTSRKPRKVSMQARNSTDKTELLFKILVIGELGTGKTSIIKRYVHQFFSQHYRATIGVDFALKVLQWDNDSMIRLQLWDIAGQERFGNMTRVYYKEAVGAFIVFDVTRVSTFEAVTKWKQDLDAKVQLAHGEPIPCVLLANKCDQPKEGIINNHNKMDEFCKENQFIGWFETSAKENINIDEAANCLVAKIVQNDQKRLEEKEATNGTGVINVKTGNSEPTKSKICGAC